MKKRIERMPLLVLLVLAITGCTGVMPTKFVNVGDMNTRTSSLLNICRPDSIIRSMESPDIFINGNILSELKNGSSFSFNVHKGDKFSVETTANALLYRFKNEIIVSGDVSDSAQYIVVTAERNLSQGLSVLFGGAIAEVSRQNVSGSSSSGSWSYVRTSLNEYKSACEIEPNDVPYENKDRHMVAHNEGHINNLKDKAQHAIKSGSKPEEEYISLDTIKDKTYTSSVPRYWRTKSKTRKYIVCSDKSPDSCGDVPLDYREHVRNKIKSTLRFSIPKMYTETIGSKIFRVLHLRSVIGFTLDRDGKLLNTKIIDSSGNLDYDRYAEGVVVQSQPFNPIPITGRERVKFAFPITYQSP